MDDARGFHIRVLLQERHGVACTLHFRQFETVIRKKPAIEVLRWFDLGDLIGGDNAIPGDLLLTELRDEHGEKGHHHEPCDHSKPAFLFNVGSLGTR